MKDLRVAVLGVGLIGGSIGLGARSRADAHVAGYDPNGDALSLAIERGAIDEACASVADAVTGADVVFAAAPVGALPALVDDALAAAPPDCVVSDVGSTKQALVEAVSDPRFVGGHPLAGAETAGVEHAREDLFDGAVWYLVPGSYTAERSIMRVSELTQWLGAKPASADAATHDRLMACVSHLPHVIANVLVGVAGRALLDAGKESGPLVFDVGPSFRDATRVAGANTTIWTDIYMSNRAALMEAIDEAHERLRKVQAMLQASDAEALRQWGYDAESTREALRAISRASGS